MSMVARDRHDHVLSKLAVISEVVFFILNDFWSKLFKFPYSAKIKQKF